jgi:outer membrane protein assembly factor BamB
MTRPGLAQDLFYSFENGASDWTGETVTGGPWSVTEWSAFGRGSLKADIQLIPGASYSMKQSRRQDLTAYGWISAVVTRSWWGDFGEGLFARLYVKTGPNWEWHEGVTVPVAPSFSQFYYAHNTVLDLNLAGIPQLNDVREIGVQFLSGASAQGKAAIYIGHMTLAAKQENEVFPSWVWPQSAVDDGFGRYFSVGPQSIARLNTKDGTQRWEHKFPESVRAFFPKTQASEALYLVGQGSLWALDRETGAVKWTLSLPAQAYVEVVSDQEQSVYLSLFNGDERQLHALDQRNGKTLWQIEGIELSALANDQAGRLYAKNGVLVVLTQDPVQQTHAVGGVDKASGKWVWSYADGLGSSFRLYGAEDQARDLYIYAEGGSRSYLRRMEGDKGRPLWVYEGREPFTVESTEAAGRQLLLRISQTLVAVDRARGQAQWSYDAGGFFTLAQDERKRAYVRVWQDSREKVVALNPDGAVRWQYESAGGFLNIDGRNIYLVENSPSTRQVAFFDPETGTIRWSRRSSAESLWIWNEGGTYLLVEDDRFTALNPLTGSGLWTFSGTRTSQVLQADSQNIYFITQDKTYSRPPRVSAVARASGELRWNFQAGANLGGLILGASRGAEAQGSILFQYIVGSKFPITQGVIALPQVGPRD